MSSILKALKKVEQDKKAHRNDDAGSSKTILRDIKTRDSFFKSARPVILVSVICTAITYIGLAYFYKPENKNVPVAAVPTTQPVTVVAPFKTISSAAKTFKNSTSITIAKKTLQQAISSPKKTGKPKNIPISAAEYSKRKITGETGRTPVIRRAVPAMPAEKLTVNGIALSDGETRQAVVNGVTVSKGSYVGGAKVEEILQNRVRFSRGGIKFDVIVGDSGP